MCITQEFSGDEKPCPPALTLGLQARCAHALRCLTTQVYFYVQTLWCGLTLFFWNPWGIADGQMELFLNGPLHQIFSKVGWLLKIL